MRTTIRSVIVSALVFSYGAWAFAPTFRRHDSVSVSDISRITLFGSTEKEVEKPDIIKEEVEEFYPDGQLYTLNLTDHRPLGCTVEESLDTEKDPSVVLVTKIIEGGNAEAGGLKVGDVLVGVNGLFGDMTPVLKAGVEKM